MGVLGDVADRRGDARALLQLDQALLLQQQQRTGLVCGIVRNGNFNLLGAGAPDQRQQGNQQQRGSQQSNSTFFHDCILLYFSKIDL